MEFNFEGKKKRVLDIGCHSGKKVLKYKDDLEIYGADIDTSRFIPEIKDRLFFLDITKPLPKTKPFDEPFDYIFLEEVLEHLEDGDDKKALDNIYKLLKKGGHLVITTPKSVPYFEFFDPAWVRWKLGYGERHHHYGIEELFCKITQSGFALGKNRITGNLWWLFCRWFNLPLKHIFKFKKLLPAPRRKGFFGWEITAKKMK